jgi:sarcosine oxidase, subunit gamma
MPLDLTATRRGPVDELAVRGGVALLALPPASRFILRGRPNAIAAAGEAFGVALPQQACRAPAAGDRAALWLGPDEWLLLASAPDGAALRTGLERAMDGKPHSLVDVSHRQTGIEISGAGAVATLNAGCPLDLDPRVFLVGMCTRTVLAKSEIVLWRTAPVTFHLEAWRSFAPYIRRLLEEASREFPRLMH